MDDWEKLKETSLPEKEDFSDSAHAEYTHSKRVYKGLKNLGKHLICMFKMIHYY